MSFVLNNVGLSVTEGSGFSFDVSPDSALLVARTIRWEIIFRGDMPAFPSDFISLSGDLDFVSGATASQTITLAIADDNSYEIDREFAIRVWDTHNTVGDISDDTQIGEDAVVILQDDDTNSFTNSVNAFTGLGDNTFTAASSVFLNFVSASGDDSFIITRFQYGDVRINDTAGSSYIKFDRGVAIEAINEEVVSFGGRDVSSVDLVLSTGSTITIDSPTKPEFQYQLGDGDLLNYGDFVSTLGTVSASSPYVVTGSSTVAIPDDGFRNEISLYRTVGDDIVGLGSDFDLSVTGGLGDDSFIITRFQTGDVSISDTAGSSYIKFDRGVTIVSVYEEVVSFGGREVTSVDLILSTGSTINIDAPTKLAFQYQFGDGVLLNYEDFVSALSSVVVSVAGDVSSDRYVVGGAIFGAGPYHYSVSENLDASGVGNAMVLGSISATVTSGETLNYAFDGGTLTDSLGHFAITSVGEISYIGSGLDRETTSVHYLKVQATSSDGSVDVANISIEVDNVNEAPVLLSMIGSQTVTIAVDLDISSFFGDGDVASSGDELTYTAMRVDSGGVNPTALPSGLSINADTGIFSASSSVVGVTYQVEVTATDSGGLSVVSNVFDLHININTAPVISNAIDDVIYAPLVGGRIIIADSRDITSNVFSDADGDALTYTATLSNGSPLPSGVSLTDVNGVTQLVFSNAVASGVYDFSVMATDMYGLSVMDTFSVTINTIPIVSGSIDDVTVNEGTVHTITIDDGVSNVFGDPEGDTLIYTVTLSDGSPLPSGVSLIDVNGVTQLIFSNTVAVGTYNFTLTATDTGGASVTDMFTFVINASPRLEAIVFTGSDDTVLEDSFSLESSVDGSLSFSDVDNPLSMLSLRVMVGDIDPTISTEALIFDASGEVSIDGVYGAFTFTRDATTSAVTWRYDLDNADADTNSLDVGESVTDSVKILVSDTGGAVSSVATLSVRVSGSNDAPSVTTTGTASIDEGTFNVDTPTGLSIHVSDPEGDVSFSLNVVGDNRFSIDGNNHLIIQQGSVFNYESGEVSSYGTITVEIRVTDTHDVMLFTQISREVSIVDLNIAPPVPDNNAVTFTNNDDVVTEDDFTDSSVSGSLSFSDFNSGDPFSTFSLRVTTGDIVPTIFTEALIFDASGEVSFDGVYGRFTFRRTDSSMTWIYVLDNAASDTDVLDENTFVQDAVKILVSDTGGGVSSIATLSVNVSGSNDLHQVIQMVGTPSVDEGVLTVDTDTGVRISLTDVEGDKDFQFFISSPETRFEVLTDNNGVYRLIAKKDAVFDYEVGHQIQIMITVVDRHDATNIAVLNVTVDIVDVNDSPAFSSPTAITFTNNDDVVTEDDSTDSSVGGALSFSDEDSGDTFDSLTLRATTEGIVPTSSTVALVFAIVSGSVSKVASIDGVYGRFTFGRTDSTMTWRYVLDNNNSATNALSSGESVTDSVQFIVGDDENAVSSIQSISVNITGSDDAPVLNIDTHSQIVIEERTLTQDTDTGVRISLTDVEGDLFSLSLDDARFKVVNDDGVYNIYALSGAVFDYEDSNNPNGTLSITVTASDVSHTSRSFTSSGSIDIIDVNDSPAFSLPNAITFTNNDDTVLEDSSLVDSSVHGFLSFNDVDSGDVFSSLSLRVEGGDIDPTISTVALIFDTSTNEVSFDGVYGRFTFGRTDSTMTWRYVLDNNNSDTNALSSGESATDTIKILVSDDENAVSSIQSISVNITGSNDAPLLSISGTQNAIFEGILATDSDTGLVVDVFDVDSAVMVSIAPGFFSLDAYEDGTYHIILNKGSVIDYEDSMIINGVIPITLTATDSLTSVTVSRGIVISDVSDTPSFSNASDESIFILESVQGSAIIYRASTVSPAVLSRGSVSYSLTSTLSGSDDATSFSINRATGVITINDAPDYETRSLYRLTLTAHSFGFSVSKNLVVNITNEDLLMVFTEGASVTRDVQETMDVNSAVIYTPLFSYGEVVAANVRFSFGNDTTTEGVFDIDALTGEITLHASLDYETNRVHNFTIKASVLGSTIGDITQNIRLNILNVNDSIEFLAGRGVIVSDTEHPNVVHVQVYENISDDRLIYTAIATSEVPNANIVYNLDRGMQFFRIDSESGELRLKLGVSLDYDVTTHYELTIRATLGTENNAPFTTHMVHLNVVDVAHDAVIYNAQSITNETVVLDGVSDLYSFVHPVFLIGTEDTIYQIFYHLSGSDADQFVIDPHLGFVRFNDVLSSPVESQYHFTINAGVVGGASTSLERHVTVNVSDVNEGDTGAIFVKDITPSAFDLREGYESDAPNDRAFSMDWEGVQYENGLLVFYNSLEGTASTYIVGSGVEFKKGGVVVHQHIIEASDDIEGIIAIKPSFDVIFDEVSINLKGGSQLLNDVRLFGSEVVQVDIARNLYTDSVVSVASQNDAVYSHYRLEGIDSADFTIDRLTGVITINESPDYEVQDRYFFIVVREDEDEAGSAVSVSRMKYTVHVDDTLSVYNSVFEVIIDENIVADSVVHDATLGIFGGQSDYHLGGVDSADFTINRFTGLLTINKSPDYETKSRYEFHVNVVDSEGVVGNQIMVINVRNDSTEAPVVNAYGYLDEIIEERKATWVVKSDEASSTYTLLPRFFHELGSGSLFYNLNSVNGLDSSVYSWLFLDSLTGVMTVQAGSSDRGNDYVLSVMATNEYGAQVTKIVTLHVIDPDAPVLTSDRAVSFMEDQIDSGDVVYIATAISDIGSAVTFSLKGEDESLFTINSMTGKVTILEDLNYEMNSQYDFIIATEIVSEGNRHVSEWHIVLNVSDVIVEDVSVEVNNRITPNNLGIPFESDAADGEVVFISWEGAVYRNGIFILRNTLDNVESEYIKGSEVAFRKSGSVVYSKTINSSGGNINIRLPENLVFDEVVLTHSGDHQDYRGYDIFGDKVTEITNLGSASYGEAVTGVLGGLVEYIYFGNHGIVSYKNGLFVLHNSTDEATKNDIVGSRIIFKKNMVEIYDYTILSSDVDNAPNGVLSVRPPFDIEFDEMVIEYSGLTQDHKGYEIFGDRIDEIIEINVGEAVTGVLGGLVRYIYFDNYGVDTYKNGSFTLYNSTDATTKDYIKGSRIVFKKNFSTVYAQVIDSDDDIVTIIVPSNIEFDEVVIEYSVLTQDHRGFVISGTKIEDVSTTITETHFSSHITPTGYGGSVTGVLESLVHYINFDNYGIDSYQNGSFVLYNSTDEATKNDIVGSRIIFKKNMVEIYDYTILSSDVDNAPNGVLLVRPPFDIEFDGVVIEYSGLTQNHRGYDIFGAKVETVSVSEDIAVGSVIYAYDAHSDGHIYELRGSDASDFTVSHEGIIFFNNSPDYETKNNYDIFLTVRDYFGDRRGVEIRVAVEQSVEQSAGEVESIYSISEKIIHFSGFAGSNSERARFIYFDNYYTDVYRKGVFVLYNSLDDTGSTYIENAVVVFKKHMREVHRVTITSTDDIITVRAPENIEFDEVVFVHDTDNQDYRGYDIFGVEVDAYLREDITNIGYGSRHGQGFEGDVSNFLGVHLTESIAFGSYGIDYYKNGLFVFDNSMDVVTKEYIRGSEIIFKKGDEIVYAEVINSSDGQIEIKPPKNIIFDRVLVKHSNATQDYRGFNIFATEVENIIRSTHYGQAFEGDVSDYLGSNRTQYIYFGNYKIESYDNGEFILYNSTDAVTRGYIVDTIIEFRNNDDVVHTGTITLEDVVSAIDNIIRVRTPEDIVFNKIVLTYSGDEQDHRGFEIYGDKVDGIKDITNRGSAGYGEAVTGVLGGLVEYIYFGNNGPDFYEDGGFTLYNSTDAVTKDYILGSKIIFKNNMREVYTDTITSSDAMSSIIVPQHIEFDEVVIEYSSLTQDHLGYSIWGTEADSASVTEDYFSEDITNRGSEHYGQAFAGDVSDYLGSNLTEYIFFDASGSTVRCETGTFVFYNSTDAVTKDYILGSVVRFIKNDSVVYEYTIRSHDGVITVRTPQNMAFDTVTLEYSDAQQDHLGYDIFSTKFISIVSITEDVDVGSAIYVHNQHVEGNTYTLQGDDASYFTVNNLGVMFLKKSLVDTTVKGRYDVSLVVQNSVDSKVVNLEVNVRDGIDIDTVSPIVLNKPLPHWIVNADYPDTKFYKSYVWGVLGQGAPDTSWKRPNTSRGSFYAVTDDYFTLAGGELEFAFDATNDQPILDENGVHDTNYPVTFFRGDPSYTGDYPFLGTVSDDTRDDVGRYNIRPHDTLFHLYNEVPYSFFGQKHYPDREYLFVPEPWHLLSRGHRFEEVSYDFTFTVLDGLGNSIEALTQIHIIDAFSAVLSSDLEVSVAEGKKTAGEVIYTSKIAAESLLGTADVRIIAERNLSFGGDAVRFINEDPDGPEFYLSGEGEGAKYFRIDPETGVVTLKKDLDFDYYQQSSYEFTIVVKLVRWVYTAHKGVYETGVDYSVWQADNFVNMDFISKWNITVNVDQSSSSNSQDMTHSSHGHFIDYTLISERLTRLGADHYGQAFKADGAFVTVAGLEADVNGYKDHVYFYHIDERGVKVDANGVSFDENVYYTDGLFVLYNNIDTKKAGYINGSVIEFLKDGVVVDSHIIDSKDNIITVRPSSDIVFNEVVVEYEGDRQDNLGFDIFGRKADLAVVSSRVDAFSLIYDASSRFGEGNRYVLQGDDASDFVIDPYTGRIFIRETPRGEGQTLYDLDVVVTDVSGQEIIQRVILEIKESNDAPYVYSLDDTNTDYVPVLYDKFWTLDRSHGTGGSTYFIDPYHFEDEMMGDMLVDVYIDDINVKYDANYDWLNYNEESGILSLTRSNIRYADSYEGLHYIKVVATDSIGQTAEDGFWLNVVGVNDPILTSNSLVNIDENATGVLYKAIVSVLDSSTSVAFSLEGDDASRFNINDQGHVTLKEGLVLDYEAQSSYVFTISIQASDGYSSKWNMKFNVQNIVEDTVVEHIYLSLYVENITNRGTDVTRGDGFQSDDAHDYERELFSVGDRSEVFVNGSFILYNSTDTRTARYIRDSVVEFKKDSEIVYSETITVSDRIITVNAPKDIVFDRVILRHSGFDQDYLGFEIFGIEKSIVSIDENIDVSHEVYRNVFHNYGMGYTLEGVDASYFIVDAVGNIYFKVSPDYETKSRYDLVLLSSDHKNDESIRMIQFDIQDIVNEAVKIVYNYNEINNITPSDATQAVMHSNAYGSYKSFHVGSGVHKAGSFVLYNSTDAISREYIQGSVIKFKYNSETVYSKIITISDAIITAVAPENIVFNQVVLEFDGDDPLDYRVEIFGLPVEYVVIAENNFINNVVYVHGHSDGLNYVVQGEDGLSFTVNDQGVVTLNDAPDYETKSSYSVDLVITDENNSQVTQVIRMDVANVVRELSVAPEHLIDAMPVINQRLSDWVPGLSINAAVESKYLLQGSNDETWVNWEYAVKLTKINDWVGSDDIATYKIPDNTFSDDGEALTYDVWMEVNVPPVVNAIKNSMTSAHIYDWFSFNADTNVISLDVTKSQWAGNHYYDMEVFVKATDESGQSVTDSFWVNVDTHKKPKLSSDRVFTVQESVDSVGVIAVKPVLYTATTYAYEEPRISDGSSSQRAIFGAPLWGQSGGIVNLVDWPLDPLGNVFFNIEGTDAGYFDIDSVSGKVTLKRGYALDYDVKQSYDFVIRAGQEFQYPDAAVQVFGLYNNIGMHDLFQGLRNRVFYSRWHVTLEVEEDEEVTSSIIDGDIESASNGDGDVRVFPRLVFEEGRYERNESPLDGTLESEHAIRTLVDSKAYKNGSLVIYNSVDFMESQYIQGSIVEGLKNGEVVYAYTIRDAADIITITFPETLIFDELRVILNGADQYYRGMAVFGDKVTYISENVEHNSVVYRYDSHEYGKTYALQGTDAGSFAVNYVGLVYFDDFIEVDYEQQQYYDVSLVITDAEGDQFVEDINIHVKNIINEEPALVGSLDDWLVKYGTRSYYSIGDVFVDDGSLRYEIIIESADSDAIGTSWMGDESMWIAKDLGWLSFDQESKTLIVDEESAVGNAYKVTVFAVDTEGNVAGGSFNLTIETSLAPTLTSALSVTIDENVATVFSQDVFYTAETQGYRDNSFSDVVYGVEGRDSDYFNIHPVTGKLRFKEGIVLDYDEQSSYNLLITTAVTRHGDREGIDYKSKYRFRVDVQEPSIKTIEDKGIDAPIVYEWVVVVDNKSSKTISLPDNLFFNDSTLSNVFDYTFRVERDEWDKPSTDVDDASDWLSFDVGLQAFIISKDYTLVESEYYTIFLTAENNQGEAVTTRMSLYLKPDNYIYEDMELVRGNRVYVDENYTGDTVGIVYQALAVRRSDGTSNFSIYDIEHTESYTIMDKMSILTANNDVLENIVERLGYSLDFTLSGKDAEYFRIEPKTGFVYFANSHKLDYETKNVYEFKIGMASSGSHLKYGGDFNHFAWEKVIFHIQDVREDAFEDGGIQKLSFLDKNVPQDILSSSTTNTVTTTVNAWEREDATFNLAKIMEGDREGLIHPLDAHNKEISFDLGKIYHDATVIIYNDTDLDAGQYIKGSKVIFKYKDHVVYSKIIDHASDIVAVSAVEDFEFDSVSIIFDGEEQSFRGIEIIGEASVDEVTLEQDSNFVYQIPARPQGNVGSVFYTLRGEDAHLFDVNSMTGRITLNTVISHEMGNDIVPRQSFEFVLVAQDLDKKFKLEQVIHVNVGDDVDINDILSSKGIGGWFIQPHPDEEGDYNISDRFVSVGGHNIIYKATLANGDPLPDVISFDPIQGSFSTDSIFDGELQLKDIFIGEYKIRVQAISDNGQTAEETFFINIADPLYEYPLPVFLSERYVDLSDAHYQAGDAIYTARASGLISVYQDSYIGMGTISDSPSTWKIPEMKTFLGANFSHLNMHDLMNSMQLYDVGKGDGSIMEFNPYTARKESGIIFSGAWMSFQRQMILDEIFFDTLTNYEHATPFEQQSLNFAAGSFIAGDVLLSTVPTVNVVRRAYNRKLGDVWMEFPNRKSGSVDDVALSSDNALSVFRLMNPDSKGSKIADIPDGRVKHYELLYAGIKQGKTGFEPIRVPKFTSETVFSNQINQNILGQIRTEDVKGKYLGRDVGGVDQYQDVIDSRNGHKVLGIETITGRPIYLGQADSTGQIVIAVKEGRAIYQNVVYDGKKVLGITTNGEVLFEKQKYSPNGDITKAKTISHVDPATRDIVFLDGSRLPPTQHEWLSANAPVYGDSDDFIREVGIKAELPDSLPRRVSDLVVDLHIPTVETPTIVNTAMPEIGTLLGERRLLAPSGNEWVTQQIRYGVSIGTVQGGELIPIILRPATTPGGRPHIEYANHTYDGGLLLGIDVEGKPAYRGVRDAQGRIPIANEIVES